MSYNLSDDFTKYFVFPKLVTEYKNQFGNRFEIKNVDEFMEILEDNKKVFISGSTNSGKTTLMKHLFISIANRNKVPLLLSVDSKTKIKKQTFIRHLFEEQYGEDSALYERYQQLDKDKKVILIDGWDVLQEKSKENLISMLDADFGYIIFSLNGKKSNVIDSIKDQLTDSKPLFRSDFGYNDILSYDSGGHMKGQGIISGINYTITLSNNSKQRISLVDYDISYSSGELTYCYGNMVNAIKDSNNQPVSMPIILDAGESMVVTYEINTIVPQNVNMLLIEKYGTEAEIPQDELRDYLGENNLDIFGNDIKYYKYEDGNYLIQIEEPQFPVYNLRFVTSKGSYFECKLSQ